MEFVRGVFYSEAMPSTFSASTSTGLLDRVRERDADAWRRLARLYTPLVYRWSRQCGLQASDASDVAQEVFTAVARNVDRFRHDHPDATFRGWLWMITRNQIRLHFRRAKQRPTAQGGSTANLLLAEDGQLTGDVAEPILGQDAKLAALLFRWASGMLARQLDKFGIRVGIIFDLFDKFVSGFFKF